MDNAANIGRFSTHSWGTIEQHDLSWVKYPNIDPKFFHQDAINKRAFLQNDIKSINIKLFVAITNECGLITNEYALADLSNATLSLPDMSDCTSTLVYTAEDLVLCAYSESKLTFDEVQNLLDRWSKVGEHVMAIKKQDFLNKGFKITKK